MVRKQSGHVVKCLNWCTAESKIASVNDEEKKSHTKPWEGALTCGE